jgi:Flp pilus assembly protein TadG
MTTRTRRRGHATLEFTLVGIPLIFVLVSVFEMSRGMWTYHTLAYALKEGTRFAIVHGSDCSTNGNTCSTTLADVANRIRSAGIGLDPSLLNVTLRVNGATAGCGKPLTTCLSGPASGTVWPGDNGQPGTDVVITGTYPFRSAIAMFWPGAGRPMGFGVFNLPAQSREMMQF